jgi:hypothetical protein
MQRRKFIAASLASAAFPLGTLAQPAASSAREYYLLRKYQLQNGPQTKLTEAYFSEALIPALTRMGLGPIGAFRLDFGPETPVFYLVIPGTSPEKLATLDLQLAQDEVFMKAAAPFWSAPATAPAFHRIDSWLVSAFPGWPRLTPATPANSAMASKNGRAYLLRTYESPSLAAHVRKVEMFHDGEFGAFTRAGFHPIFFSDTLIGPGMPSLTYMVAVEDLGTDLNARWDAFSADPAWKKLVNSPRYNYEEIVSNISNLALRPLSCSMF